VLVYQGVVVSLGKKLVLLYNFTTARDRGMGGIVSWDNNIVTI